MRVISFFVLIICQKSLRAKANRYNAIVCKFNVNVVTLWNPMNVWICLLVTEFCKHLVLRHSARPDRRLRYLSNKASPYDTFNTSQRQWPLIYHSHDTRRSLKISSSDWEVVSTHNCWTRKQFILWNRKQNVWQRRTDPHGQKDAVLLLRNGLMTCPIGFSGVKTASRNLERSRSMS